MQKHIVCFPEFAREQEVAENQTVLEAMIAAGIRVDAPCGGYNLHWAWASGLLAARSAIEDL